MSDKTKAALQSCQCHYQMFKQKQNTRLNAGGQSLSELQNSNSVLMDFSSNRGEVSKIYIRQWRTLDHTARNYPDVGGYHSLVFLHWWQSNRVVTSLSHSFLELEGSFPSKSSKWQVLNAGPIHRNYLPSSHYSRKPYRIIAIRALGKGLGHISFLSHKFRMCNKNALSHLCASSFSFNQPFGSIPRCCSSLRMMRLIQAARDSSPSWDCACSIRSRNSGSSLNWNGGLPRLSFLCVDTLITPDVMCLCVITHYTQERQIATPRSAGTPPRRLTSHVNRSNAMAKPQHTQTRPEFTWLFLATPNHTPECTPIVLRFDADTEDKARSAFPGWDLVFAAKIRAKSPCRVVFFDYCTRRGWVFDDTSEKEVVVHG